MTSSGPNYCGTATGVSQGEGNAWLNPTNAQGSTNFAGQVTGATCSSSNGAIDGDYLYLTNFGFSIPTGATINGILAELEAKSSGTNVTLAFYQLLIAGSPAGTNMAATPIAVPTTPTNLSQGGSSTLWGLTPTVAQVNASNFGFMVEHTEVSGGRVFTVYGGRITITYTPAAGGPFPFFLDPDMGGE